MGQSSMLEHGSINNIMCVLFSSMRNRYLLIGIAEVPSADTKRKQGKRACLYLSKSGNQLMISSALWV